MKKKGQVHIENILVISMVLGVSILGVTIFGDNLSVFFQSKEYPTESSKRASITADTNKINLVSETMLLDGNNEFKTPIEKIVRQNIIEKNYIQTTGPQGNIYETVLIMKEYLDQLKQVVSQGNSSDQSVKNFLAALDSYDSKVNQYLQYNDKIVNHGNDPILKLLNELDVSINLEANGEAALNLQSALLDLTKTLPNSSLKGLVELYTSDLIAFGKSLDYHIDSRIQNNIQTFEQNANLQQEVDPEKLNPVKLKDNAAKILKQAASLLGDAATNISKNNNGIPTNDADLMAGLAESLPLQSANSWAVNSTDYWGNTQVKKLNGQDEFTNRVIDGSLTLSNGMSMAIDISEPVSIPIIGSFINLFISKTPPNIWVDVDGPNAGAGQIGSDIFGFVIVEDQIVPMGSPESKISDSSCIQGGTSSSNTGWGCTQQLIDSTASSKNSIATDTPSPSATPVEKEELKEYLQHVAINPDISQEEKESIAKQVKIYRSGSLQEIAPDSMNTHQLCGSIQADVQNSACQLRPYQPQPLPYPDKSELAKQVPPGYPPHFPAYDKPPHGMPPMDNADADKFFDSFFDEFMNHEAMQNDMMNHDMMMYSETTIQGKAP